MAITGISPPPPLLLLACLLAGRGLGRVHPLGTGLPRALRHWRTTVKPNGEASALLTAGPFRWTRNPLYLSLAAVLAGCGLVGHSAWMLLLTPVLVLLLDRIVIAWEEVRLDAQFGEVYRTYTRQVRRWL